jgi:hypothetical protein
VRGAVALATRPTGAKPMTAKLLLKVVQPGLIALVGGASNLEALRPRE